MKIIISLIAIAQIIFCVALISALSSCGDTITAPADVIIEQTVIHTNDGVITSTYYFPSNSILNPVVMPVPMGTSTNYYVRLFIEGYELRDSVTITKYYYHDATGLYKSQSFVPSFVESGHVWVESIFTNYDFYIIVEKIVN